MSKLKELLTAKKATLLGLGPMSLNSITAIVESANQFEIPTQMIASRRQIDDAANGGGYVAGLTTETFIPLVRKLDKKNMIMVARDHGGPWQNFKEVQEMMDLSRAMKSAKESFARDIEQGMDAIHIDPSIDPNGASEEQIIDRIVELYEFCFEMIQRLGKKVMVEIGSEEQAEGFPHQEKFTNLLASVLKKTNKLNLPNPDFIVLQSGTKVLDTKNYGDLVKIQNLDLVANPGLRELHNCLSLCHSKGMMVKSHNGDYLEEKTLRHFPFLGVDGLNIAPELGVLETRVILSSLLEHGLKYEYEEIIQELLSKGHWRKWVHPSNPVNDLVKAEISGHYSFHAPFFIEIKNKLNQHVDIDAKIQSALKYRIKRLYQALNWGIV